MTEVLKPGQTAEEALSVKPEPSQAGPAGKSDAAGTGPRIEPPVPSHPVIAEALESLEAGPGEREIKGQLERDRERETAVKQEAEDKSGGGERTQLTPADSYWQSRHDMILADLGIKDSSELAGVKDMLTKVRTAEAETADRPEFQLPEDFDVADLGDPKSESFKALFGGFANVAANASRKAVREELTRNRAMDSVTGQHPELQDPKLQEEFKSFISDPGSWDAGYAFEVFQRHKQDANLGPVAPQPPAMSLNAIPARAGVHDRRPGEGGEQDNFQREIVGRHTRRTRDINDLL